MLSPVDYQRDCNEIVATLVDHKILVGEQRDRGLVKARALWEKVYPEEPFEVDLAPLFATRQISNQELNMTSRLLVLDRGFLIIKCPYLILRTRDF